MAETRNALSKKEVRELLNFFEENEYLIINKEVNQELLRIITKINFFPAILDVGVPQDKHIIHDGLHVSLLPDGKKQLQNFVEE